MAIEAILDRALKARASQEELYIDLHQHPELSMQETRTRGIIEDKLKALGYEVVLIGGGVVGVLHNGPGKTVLLRADFDALPVREDSGLDYASTATGTDAEGNEVPVMHACGHDTHVTSLLGCAEAMAKARDEWSGTLEVLFQPGEETAEGARSMVEAGLVDVIPHPDLALGQHVFLGPTPAGDVALNAGPVLSTATSMTIKIHGRGSHGSMPHLSVDPVVLASAIVMRLQTVVSRELVPGEFGVLTVGAIQAGSKSNIIPDSATLLVNIRAYSDHTREQIATAVERIVHAECEAARCPRPAEITQHGQFPLTNNNAEVTAAVRSSLEKALGAEHVHQLDPVTASEDFSVLPEAFGIPYCFWTFGGRSDGQIIPNHSPFFAPEIQPTIATGTAALIAGAYAFLGQDAEL